MKAGSQSNPGPCRVGGTVESWQNNREGRRATERERILFKILITIQTAVLHAWLVLGSGLYCSQCGEPNRFELKTVRCTEILILRRDTTNTNSAGD